MRLQEGDTVRSLGPLIHNEQEMQRLGTHGVTTISDPVQIGRGETAVIRAHGVTPDVQKRTRRKSVESCRRDVPVRYPRAETRRACGGGRSTRHRRRQSRIIRR